VKKRLRKKKHLGEFREFGFGVSATLRVSLDEQKEGDFIGRLIAFVDARDLCFGGGGAGTSFGCFITSLLAGHNATEEDRAAVEAFLKADADVETFEVERLRDAWYGWHKD
jgi:uncharacterized protein